MQKSTNTSLKNLVEEFLLYLSAVRGLSENSVIAYKNESEQEITGQSLALYETKRLFIKNERHANSEK